MNYKLLRFTVVFFIMTLVGSLFCTAQRTLPNLSKNVSLYSCPSMPQDSNVADANNYLIEQVLQDTSLSLSDTAKYRILQMIQYVNSRPIDSALNYVEKNMLRDTTSFFRHDSVFLRDTIYYRNDSLLRAKIEQLMATPQIDSVFLVDTLYKKDTIIRNDIKDKTHGEF